MANVVVRRLGQHRGCWHWCGRSIMSDRLDDGSRACKLLGRSKKVERYAWRHAGGMTGQEEGFTGSEPSSVFRAYVSSP